ncbi:hypothetical protein [Streptomonospora salina]|uniref:Uncharacterized protein n=1 Tax=Streptomonospora salina TaxID=104205 RepID=A0A841EB40_9ACTN|nr:hypothetical protein [Streptomonospora salina]MBB6000232.1 hypothetical protein [Streptomonospora salina]
MFSDRGYALRTGYALAHDHLIRCLRRSVAGDPDEALLEQFARMFVAYVNDNHLDESFTWVPRYAVIIGPSDRADDPALEQVEHAINTAFTTFCSLMPGSAH